MSTEVAELLIGLTVTFLSIVIVIVFGVLIRNYKDDEYHPYRSRDEISKGIVYEYTSTKYVVPDSKCDPDCDCTCGNVPSKTDGGSN